MGNTDQNRPETTRPLTEHDLLRQREWVRRIAERLVADGATADDLAQDAMVVALRSRDGGGAAGNGWLAGVTRHLALQRVRAEARRARREREASQRSDTSVSDRSVTEALDEVESHRRLLDHVMALDEPYRDVLVKRYFKRMPPGAIAREEGRTVASISNRLSRAHEALRRRLEADGGKGAWIQSLLPLVAAPKLAPAASLVLLSSPWLLGGAAVLVAAAALVLLLRPPSADGSAVPPVDDLRERTETSTALLAPAEPGVVRVDEAKRGRVPDAQAVVESAGLVGTLMDGEGQPVEGAVVTLKSGGDAIGQAVVDATGGVSWDELPAASDVSVHVRLRDWKWAEPVDRVELAAGVTANAAWTVHTTTVVRGLLVNEEGTPLPGQVMRWIRPNACQPSLGAIYDEDTYRATTVTDASGEFVIPPMPPGCYHVACTKEADDIYRYELMPDRSVRATQEEGGVLSPQEVARHSTVVEVPVGEPTMDVVVKVATAGRVAGRVASSLSGEPLTGIHHLQIAAASGWGQIALSTEEDGTFRSPPLPPGDYRVFGMRGTDGWCPGGHVDVRSGAQDVAVPFDLAAEVAIRISYDPDVTFRRGNLRIVPMSEGRPEGETRFYSLTDPLAEVTEKTLRPGLYGVVFRTHDGAAGGVIEPRDLGAGALPGGLVLRARPTATITIENASSDVILRANASIHGMEFETTVVDTGRSGIVHAPPGVTHLVLTGHEGEPAQSHTLDLESGDTRTVTWR